MKYIMLFVCTLLLGAAVLKASSDICAAIQKKGIYLTVNELKYNVTANDGTHISIFDDCKDNKMIGIE